MSSNSNIFYWQDRGARIQYKYPEHTVWTTVKNPIRRLNPKFEYRVHPDDAQGFHIEGRKWWNGSYHEWSCSIFWRGQELFSAQCGYINAGKRARDWFQDMGIFLPKPNSCSEITVGRKKDL